MKIDNRQQLNSLHMRYAQMEGANAVAQQAINTAQQTAKAYLDALNMLTGYTPREGQRVEVDWDSGEVTVADERVNGVAV